MSYFSLMLYSFLSFSLSFFLFFFFFLCLFVLKTSFHCVALDVLELTL